MTVAGTPTPAPIANPASDALGLAAALAGQYEIEREVGRGGMGLVYAARDLRLDRRVAIKTLLPHLASDPAMRERFLREARTAASLFHQHIVPVHRADEIGGHVFFVMGFVDGESMAQRIRARGRLEPVDTIRMLRDVAAALGHAHDHGVIHRDVKAENILIDGATGHAMMTDFGIARLAEATPLTSTGQMLGTVYYSSPEQVSGGRIDARSDIYSLGVVGFLALTGVFPFDAELASAVLIAHVNTPPPSVLDLAPNAPPGLAAVIDQCLLKDPRGRFQRCDELDAALAAVDLSARSVDARPAPRASTPALVSDTEARAIWERAADLQAMTGVRARPAPMAGARDRERDAARTSGFHVADIRDAAIEAGIANRYVEHALAEHGLPSSVDVVPIPVARGAPVVVDRARSRGILVGGPTQLDYEIVVDGEMPSDDFDLLAEITRRATSDPGHVSEIGRSFAWHASPAKHIMHVSVRPRAGKTTIRVTEDLRQWAAGLFVGISAIGVVATMGPATIFLAPLVGFLGMQGFFGVISRRRQRAMRSLAQELATQVIDSIQAARKPKALLDAPPFNLPARADF